VRARDAVTPISLVVLAVGSAAYAYLVDRRTISDADRAARKGEVFPSFRVDQVARVELDQGGSSLVLERDADAGVGPASSSGWLITSPRRERADAAEVDTLLRELELAKRVRDVPEGEAVGLDAPRVRGQVTVGALEYRFALGGDAPRPEGAAYMRLDADKAFVVGRTLKVQLLRGADAYRDRALVPYGASDTARVEVRGAQPGDTGFAIERHGTTFRVVGSGLRASRATVDQLFAALGDTRAETFLDDAQADRAMTGAGAGADHAWTVTVAPRSGDRAPIELHVGGRCPVPSEGIVVVRVVPSRGPGSRISACAPKTIALALEAAPAALTDTSPLFARTDEIEDLRLEATLPAARRVELARKDRGWHEREPEERDLDADESESANALAAALTGARATEARSAQADEHFVARARATVIRTGGGASEVVEIGQPEPDGSSLMRRDDDGALLRIPRAAARRFLPQPSALRARGIWGASPGGPRRVPFEAASVVAVDDSCGMPAQRLDLRDGLWTMRQPRGSHANAAVVTDLLDALAHAKADAWIADADDGSFGLDGSGACAVSLTFGGGAGAGTRAGVVFGAAGDGGVYARMLDDKAVFVAPASLRDMASRACSTHGDAGLP
jgi:hypothetical protein